MKNNRFSIVPSTLNQKKGYGIEKLESDWSQQAAAGAGGGWGGRLTVPTRYSFQISPNSPHSGELGMWSQDHRLIKHGPLQPGKAISSGIS